MVALVFTSSGRSSILVPAEALAPLLVGAGVAALVLTVTGKVAHFKGQEDALPDIGIQGRLTDRRLELQALDADFSKDRRRRIAVFHDPPFNVGRQFVVVADL